MEDWAGVDMSDGTLTGIVLISPVEDWSSDMSDGKLG